MSCWMQIKMCLAWTSSSMNLTHQRIMMKLTNTLILQTSRPSSSWWSSNSNSKCRVKLFPEMTLFRRLVFLAVKWSLIITMNRIQMSRIWRRIQTRAMIKMRTTIIVVTSKTTKMRSINRLMASSWPIMTIIEKTYKLLIYFELRPLI